MGKRKKIIIDAYQYSRSITGTDRMAHNFLRELQSIDKTNEYIILCSRVPYISDSINGSNFKVIKPTFFSSLPVVGRYFGYIWRKGNKLWLIRHKADVYYSFHNMQLPGRRLAKRTIASNLDLIPIVLDEYKQLGRLTPDEQINEYKRVAGLADHFVSISDYSKRELCERLNVDAAKVSVVHLAADAVFNSPTDITSPPLPLGAKFIFTIGGSEPRKNVATIVKAYQSLPKEIRDEYKLVIAGGKWHHKTLEDLKVSEDIITLGYAEDSLLPWLYKNAECFVFASEYEGFGFAILEAMASGTPVINARGSSLDEVAGEATLTFNAHDSVELASQIKLLLSDKKLQSSLIKKGAAQNTKFSWHKAAKELHTLLIGDLS